MTPREVLGYEPNGQNGHNDGRPVKGHVPPKEVNVNFHGITDMRDMTTAICGMACRLPGGLHTPQQLWDFLLAKGDAKSHVPESRYNVSAFYDPSGRPGTVNTKCGYFLDADLTKVDGAFSCFGRGSLERMDPHHIQMMEVARECLEDAGVTNWRGDFIGCYVGSFGDDWIEMNAKENQPYGLYRSTGSGDFMLSNHVSYEMDLRGPSMTVRTACSAAMVALHEACEAVRRGDCSSAIVGGANLILAPGMTQAMSEQGVLAPDGSCKTFSADANGYGRGEAVSAIYIKPLHAALRDGNPVRAIIKQTAVNADGKTTGVTMPSTESHEALMRKAYALAGITDVSGTKFVECHGTGTPTGDPIEAKAVARVFGGTKQEVYIGSVKPNLGHSEGASGLTSLLKVVMALENLVIPPNIKFTTPNPNIPFEAGNLKVPVEPTPWPEDGLERASINSFGIGGTNAHAILESARSHGVDTTCSATSLAASASDVMDDSLEAHHLLLYSANSSGSLQRTVDAYQAFIQSKPDKLAQLAYTLANGREHLAYRAFAVATTGLEVTVSPFERRSRHTPSIIMVFTGQGAQWPAMGAELLQENNCVFESTIRSLDNHLVDTLATPPGWSLEEQLVAVGKKCQLHLAEVSQPLCAAVQIGLVDMLSSVGVKPAAVVGHSSGEIAAAYAAGVLTAKEAIVVAWLRGMAAGRQQKAGSMAAIGLGWDEVKSYLAGTTVSIACENSPRSVTISGDTSAVEAIVARVKQSPPNGQQVFSKLLKVDKAYHSYHMAEVGDDYLAALEEYKVCGQPPQNCLFYSSVTGKLVHPGEALGPEYWKRNLQSPVLFSTTVAQILKSPVFGEPNYGVLLEVGPHSVMAGPLRQILAKASASWPYVALMMQNQNCVKTYLTAMGKLHQLNVPIDLQTLVPRIGKTPFLPDLPRYAWDHDESAWWESRVSKEWRHRKHPYHELLGVRTTESTDLEPAWRNLFHVEHSSWVRHHTIVEDIVFPFAGYMSMAAEAVRQISDIQDGYALRHVIVSTALVMTDSKPLELLTALRPVRLTDSLDSQWWEFSIASHNGTRWTKHCAGQVRALNRSGDGKIIPSENSAGMPRRLGTHRAYRIMREAGLCYGPHFQALQNIKTATLEGAATASVAAPKLDELGSGWSGVCQAYHLHPIILDACLQMLSVAATRGYRKPLGMVIPTLVEEIKVYRSAFDVDILSHADMDGLGAITGSAQCSAGGEVVLQMSRARLSPLHGEESANAIKVTHSTARCEWSPLVDFLDLTSLIGRIKDDDRRLYMSDLDEMTRLCVVYAHRRLRDLHTELPYMGKYATWVREQSSRADPTMLRMEDWVLFEAIRSKLRDLEGSPAAGVALAMFKTLSSITSIYQGRCGALDIFLADDSLTKLRALRDQTFDVSRLLRQLALSRPDLRVLELGAGMGNQTAEMLQSLVLDNGQAIYSMYTFTDPSSGMVMGARERFKSAANMQYARLDISQPLADQDMAGHDKKYDVVIATNVLHTTPNPGDSLANVRQLLRPNGCMIMQEFSSGSKWLNFIMGLLPWWWSGLTDGRIDEPYVDLAFWESALNAASLGVASSLPDSEDEALRQNNMMIVKHADAVNPRLANHSITLLHHDDTTQPRLKQDVVEALESKGYNVHLRRLGEQVPTGQDVVALLDQKDGFFDALDTQRYDAFKTLVKNASASDSCIFWITSLCQIAPCRSPSHAQVLGVARTLRSEAAVAFATCEVDDVSASTSRIAEVFRRFQLARLNDTSLDVLDPDYEYAIVHNVVQAGRFFPFRLADELVCSEPNDHVSLRMERPGFLPTLMWARCASSPLDRNLVEVKVSAVGLNFRDVLSANGIVGIPQEGFGLEASGIVSAIGPEVKDLQVGDRVFLLSRGSFSTSVTVREELCEKIPEALSLEDAATMPCVYATAIYSLFNVGRLQKGQSVLIHSACGGVGIAAIQLAQMAGAAIYATVGREEKAKYLVDTFHLPRNHIFNSHNASFMKDIKYATQGRGVDLVLNSLSGELLHATWRCVAEFGVMVEIGKRDLLGSGRLDMDVFLGNRSYCCVDLDQLCLQRGSICKELLQRAIQCYREGYILPIRPITVFSAGNIREAFRFMQQGRHMGKIVITIRDALQSEPSKEIMAATRKQEIQFDSSSSYLLVGGLGGLGRAVSRWMVEHGASHLVYLSRSAGSSDEDQDLIAELNSMGTKVTLVQGSVCEKSDVCKAVESSPNLKGVLQMSMVLRDRSWDEMTLEEWQQATTPKIRGTWNLHAATRECSLDFFVLFSSISGVIGQPGQANYAAANTFLDAFAHWRLGQGLPALAIDVAAVKDIGVISNNDSLQRAMKTTGAHMIHETELLEAVGAAIVMGNAAMARPGVVLGLASTTPLSSSKNCALWKRDMRMAAYWNTATNEAGGGASSTGALKTWLAAARQDEAILRESQAIDFLAHEIGKKLFSLLLRPEEDIHTSVSLADLGMDSLVAIEMRSWWRATFGFNISMLELLGIGDLKALSIYALNGLLKAL